MRVKKEGKKVKVLVLAMVMVMAFTFASCGSKDTSSEPESEGNNGIKIGIVQIVDHPSLNTIRDNVITQLTEEGFKDGENNCTIDVQDAQNEQTNLLTICKKFVDESYDIIIPIATPTAQAAVGTTEDIPIVFSAVTDPVEAGLVTDPGKPDKNVTGVSDAVSASKIMDLAKVITPGIKTIGALYTSSEVNSQSVVEDLKAYASKNGIEVEEAAVTASNEIPQAAAQLAEKCDAVFSPIDNTVASSMPKVVETLNKAKVPFYVGADSMVNDGGLATDGVNYVELGKETGKMAAQILNGKAVKDIPVMTMEETKYYYNPGTAKAIGVKIPESVTSSGEALGSE